MNIKLKAVLAVLPAAMLLGGCDVDQTSEGEMPDVDVDVEGGELPNYDVDTADVDVGTREETVSVPDVDVDMEEEEVTVPDIDVDMPDDDEVPEA